MDKRIGLFAVLFAIVYAAAMWMISDGIVDIASLASAPVIFSAQTIVFTMIYMATYYGEGEESLPHTPKAKPAAEQRATLRPARQH